MHRERMLRDLRRHGGENGCGRPFEEHDDPSRRLYVQRMVCRPTMKLRGMQALYEERYSGKFHDGSFLRWADKRSSEYPYAHDDGVSFYVTDVDDPTATWHLKPTLDPIVPGRWTTPAPPTPAEAAAAAASAHAAPVGPDRARTADQQPRHPPANAPRRGPA